MSVSLVHGTKIDETDFVARVAAGDKNAEREFIVHYQQGIRVLVRRYCRSDDVAVEDLAQDVLLRVLERLRAGAIRDSAALPAYIQATIVHATSAEYRNRRPTEPAESIEHIAAVGSPPEQFSGAQLRQTLYTLLTELPVARDRELLKRFYLDEEDKEDVCRQLGIDDAHFHRVVFRARERFRALLDRTGMKEALT
jgi:RNA polymerase sigma-70 factor (ECF subfamily)